MELNSVFEVGRVIYNNSNNENCRQEWQKCLTGSSSILQVPAIRCSDLVLTANIFMKKEHSTFGRGSLCCMPWCAAPAQPLYHHSSPEQRGLHIYSGCDELRLHFKVSKSMSS